MTFSAQPIQYLETPAGRIAFRNSHGPASDQPPLLLLTHLAATLDNWDPYLIDLLAQTRSVVALDYPGIGASGGTAASSISDMAAGVAEFINYSKLGPVDVLGMSMGGFVAQKLALDYPRLVHRLILVGTGPAGGRGITKVPVVTFWAMLRGFATRKDPRNYLFFPKSARDGMRGYFERQQTYTHPGKAIRPLDFIKQLKAVSAWGRKRPDNLADIPHPTLVINGDKDMMVPTNPNTFELAQRIPNATPARLYKNTGHAPLFQHPEQFTKDVENFLG